MCFCRGAFYPIHMGDHIIVGENSIINAQAIGSYVHIGKNCIIVSHTHVQKWVGLEFVFCCSLVPVY